MNDTAKHRESEIAGQVGLPAQFVRQYRKEKLTKGEHFTRVDRGAIVWNQEALNGFLEFIGRDPRNVPISATKREDDCANEAYLSSGALALASGESGNGKEIKWEEVGHEEEFWVQRIGFANNVIKAERCSDGEIFTVFVHRDDKQRYVLRTPDGERMKVWAKPEHDLMGPRYRVTRRPRRIGGY